MTTTTSDPRTPTAPTVRPLPEGAHGCQWCGCEVAPGTGSPPVPFDVLGRVGDLPPHPDQPARRLGTVHLATCAACTDRLDRAAALVADPAHARIVARIGSPSVASHRVASALAAADALGVHLPLETPADLAAALRHLTSPGAAAQWASRLTPVTLAGAHPSTCAVAPWSHLTGDDGGGVAAALREGYGALLADRVQVPHPTRPPGDGPRGCLLCGVASVLALPRAARDVWRPVSASVSALGAASGSRLHGHLCPACSTAMDAAGALGPTALEGALFAHLAPDAAARLGPYSTVEVEGVRGWGALVADADRAGRPTPAPNATPWAHAGDLDALAVALRRAVGVA